MHRSVKYAAVTFALGILAVPAGAQVEVVPRDTLRPRDVTPSIPTDSLEEEVRHTVKRGDTLWDLAKHYLRDPFRWPEVFRRNTDVVENPHWIYPGEVLRIPVGAVRPDALRVAQEQGLVAPRVVTVPTEPTPAQPPTTEGGTTVFSLGLGRQVRTLSAADRSREGGLRRGEIDAAPFVTGRRGPAGAGSVVGTAERHAGHVDLRDHRFQLNDHSYISAPAGAAPEVGAEFLALAEGVELSDSARLMVPTGVFRVIEPATGSRPPRARLVRQFGEVFVGQRLIAYEPLVPGDERQLAPAPSGASSTVLWVHNEPVLPSIQHYLVLSIPAGVTVAPGDRFTLVDAAKPGDAGVVTHPEDAALVQVVRVSPLGATALVVSQRFPTISQGMRATLTARLQ